MSKTLSDDLPASDDSQEEGSFARRWLARKRQAVQPQGCEPLPERVRAGQDDQANNIVTENETEPEAETSPDPGHSSGHHPEPGYEHDSPAAELAYDEPLFTDADMQPVDSIDTNSDLSPFFNRGVSAALRKAALRQLFRQPVFNIRDGLDDYDDDYTHFEPLGDTLTCDMKFHQARIERVEAERLLADGASQGELGGADVAADDPVRGESEETQTAGDETTQGELETADDDVTRGESEVSQLASDDSTCGELRNMTSAGGGSMPGQLQEGQGASASTRVCKQAET